MDKELEVKKQPTMAEYIGNIEKDVMANLQTQQSKGLVIPGNYAPQNALIAAMFKIKTTVDKDKKPALSVCTADSVKQSLMEMLTKGLDPNKTQCYFIVYGDKLTLFVSYFGLIHLAKEADLNIKDIYSEIVYEKDAFEYNLKHGYKQVVKHIQSIDNIDLTKIKGAYATILYKDGEERSEYMSWQQIKNSWAKGQTKGDSDAHKLSPEEMSKRTVLKRLIKSTINTSNDENLLANSLRDITNEADENENTEPIDVTPDEAIAMPVEAAQKPVEAPVSTETYKEPPKAAKASKTAMPQEQDLLDSLPDILK